MKKLLSILLAYVFGASIGLLLALTQLHRNEIHAPLASSSGTGLSPVVPDPLPPDMPTSSVLRGAMHVDLRASVEAHADY